MADASQPHTTMSSTSASTSVTKRPLPSSLMPPPPAPKRIKRPSIVLDEDTYTSAISHIIRRDFFPGLAETDAQREYLNAVESGDKGWIREAGRVLVGVMTPGPGTRGKKTGLGGRGGGGGGLGGMGGGSTPRGRMAAGAAGATPSVWGGDTPVTVSGETDVGEEDEEGENGKAPKVDLNLSLSAFQSKYTSEDQESFSQILDVQNARGFAKNEWLRTGNRYASKQRLAQQAIHQRKAIEASHPSATSTPTSQALVLRPSEDLDTRPSHVSTHKHVPFNTLMFPPDSIEDWAPTRAQKAEAASLAPPKVVVHANTRLPDPSSTSSSSPSSAENNGLPPRPGSPTMSAVRDAISGRPRLSQSEAGGGYDGSATPRVNGYAFVPARAEDDEEEEDAPTDLLERLGAGKGGPSPFTIHDAQRREKLHLKMVDRITETRSGKEREHVGSKLGIFNGKDTPRFLSAPTPRVGGGGGKTPGGMTPGRKKDIGNLTPAAQRLFANMGGGKTPRVGGVGGFGGGSGSGSGSGLGREWTPTPKVKRPRF